MTLEEEIKFALKEVEMMGDQLDRNKLLERVQKLSGAPFSFVEEVVSKLKR